MNLAYVPTLDAAEEAKDSFYDGLQDAVGRVAGPRPGPVDTAMQHILGNFAIGTRCANGNRLVNIASTNHLVFFQHSLPTPGAPLCNMVIQ